MRVGVAGLGRMGSAIAAHLIDVGHEVTVWNRTADKVKPLAAAGAKVAASPAELAGAVEAIVGDACPAAPAHAMGNPLGAFNALFAAYMAVNRATLRAVMEARRVGRRRMRGNE